MSIQEVHGSARASDAAATTNIEGGSSSSSSSSTSNGNIEPDFCVMNSRFHFQFCLVRRTVRLLFPQHSKLLCVDFCSVHLFMCLSLLSTSVCCSNHAATVVRVCVCVHVFSFHNFMYGVFCVAVIVLFFSRFMRHFCNHTHNNYGCTVDINFVCNALVSKAKSRKQLPWFISRVSISVIGKSF